MPLVTARQPFLFKSQLSLVEMTGLKASDLSELARTIQHVPESSIYYHTHHFLQQHQFLTPEPPNDFAHWVSNVLQEDLVGEALASIDTIQYHTLEDLRHALTDTIIKNIPKRRIVRQAPEGEEFHFMKAIRFTLPTPYAASNLAEFLECLRRVSVGCLYNHVFEGRLRPPLGVNDFTDWLNRELGEEDLAKKIERLDPYTYTMEGLRAKMIQLVEKRLGS